MKLMNPPERELKTALFRGWTDFENFTQLGNEWV
jgi:hypothetical protein